jgi:hypothetical protein
MLSLVATCCSLKSDNLKLQVTKVRTNAAIQNFKSGKSSFWDGEHFSKAPFSPRPLRPLKSFKAFFPCLDIERDFVPFKTTMTSTVSLEVKKIKNPKKDNIPKNPLYDKQIICNHPARVLFSGSSGSGKTTLLINLLTQKHFFLNYFDKIYIFSPSWDLDDSWRLFEKKYEKKKIKTEVTVHKKVEADDIQDILDQQDAEVTEKGIDNSPITLIVFDDCINEKMVSNNNKVFTTLFFRSRHMNISVWTTTQSYMKMPRAPRLQLSHLYLFSPSFSEAKKIAEENRNILVDEKSLLDMIVKATKQRYSFFGINKMVEPKYQYRKNLDTILEIIPLDDD